MTDAINMRSFTQGHYNDLLTLMFNLLAALYTASIDLDLRLLTCARFFQYVDETYDLVWMVISFDRFQIT